MVEIKRDGGYVTITCNGREIIAQYANGDSYISHYDELGRTTCANGGYRYLYDGVSENVSHVMTDSGNYEAFRYGPFGNQIASYRPNSGWGRGGTIYKYAYKKRKDGSVQSMDAGSESCSSYAEWLDAIPTEFPVEEYVEPVKRAAKKASPYSYNPFGNPLRETEYEMAVRRYQQLVVSDATYRSACREILAPVCDYSAECSPCETPLHDEAPPVLRGRLVRNPLASYVTDEYVELPTDLENPF